MLKVIGFIKRRADLDVAAFSRHWRTIHRANAEKLRPWLRGYVQDHLLAEKVPGYPRPADGCPVLWLDSPEALAEMAASDEYMTGAYLDEPEFMEGRSASLAVREELVRLPERTPGTVKQLRCWRGDRAALQALDRPVLGDLPRLSGHIRNVPLGGAAEAWVDYDLVEGLFWPSVAAMAADLAGAKPHGAADPARSAAAHVEELVVYPPPGR